MSSQPNAEGAKTDARKEEDRSPVQQSGEVKVPEKAKENPEKRTPKRTEESPSSPPQKPQQERPRNIFLDILVVLLSLILLFRDKTPLAQKAALERSNLTDLMRQIDGDKVSEVFLVPEGDRTFRIEATLYLDPENPQVYLLPEFNLEELSKKCIEKGVNFTTAAPRYVWLDKLREIINPIVWYGMLALGVAFLFRGSLPDLRGRRFAPETSSLRFADVGGATDSLEAHCN